jgi:hypothetical protein
LIDEIDNVLGLRFSMDEFFALIATAMKIERTSQLLGDCHLVCWE